MAHITLTGVLLDPTGEFSVGDKVKFTHQSTTGSTMKGAVSVIKVSPNGAYSINLEYGLVLVEYNDYRLGQYRNLGIATVNATNTATSIPELLNALVPASSAELIQFQAILSDAVTAKTTAVSAATTAQAFAYQLTTTALISSTTTFTAATTIPTSGFTTSGDGGNGSWKQNGVTGVAVSQTPDQIFTVTGNGGLLNDGNGNQWKIATQGVTPESLGFLNDGSSTDQAILNSTISYCVSAGGLALITKPSIISIPSGAPTLQDVFDHTSASNIAITVNIEAGHSPLSGAVINGVDFGNYTITSDDAVVTAGGTFESWLSGTYSIFPTISCLFDSNDLVNIGVHLVNTSKCRVEPTYGVINSIRYNFELRNSRADVEYGVFDGAGEVGVRCTQASNLKAQNATANSCGVTGFDISRASTANVMYGSATGCGFDTGAISGDANANNQGGLVVRRSLVAADSFNGSGSTRGISIQLSATVNAVNANISDCTITGLRTSSLSDITIGSADITDSVKGISAGFSSTVQANNADMTGCATPIELFGGDVKLNVSNATYDASLVNQAINSTEPLGTIKDTSKPNVQKTDGTYSETFAITSGGVATITPPGSGGSRACMLMVCCAAFGVNGIVWCRVNNANSSVIVGQSNLAATTGVLTGTTGTPGFVTISPASDGNIYIENRLAVAQVITIQLMAPTNFS